MGTTQHTINYQLRHHKAIDRNLFITILRKLDRSPLINIDQYRYVGFGAPFFEDFKVIHHEFAITAMDCIEYNKFAYSRQEFNNPYSFIDIYNETSSDYIIGEHFKTDKRQIIWFDFASPGQFKEQLRDIERLGERVNNLDIVKFTFNSSFESLVTSNDIRNAEGEYIEESDYKSLFKFFQEDPVFIEYFPDHFTIDDVMSDLSILLRAMGIRAINRGLSKAGKKMRFRHISSFFYRDGQKMTTFTGIVANADSFKAVLAESGLNNWEFYKADTKNEVLVAERIEVPSMTISERIAVDKLIKKLNEKQLAEQLTFQYGNTKGDHEKLINGYCKFYKYLPYYSKVIY